MNCQFKSTSAGCILALSASSLSVAADLPRVPDSHVVYAAESHMSSAVWSGLSVGILGGYGIGDGAMSLKTNAKTKERETLSIDPKGGMVGGLIGLHGQAGQWVFGVELDGAYSMLSAKAKSDSFLPQEGKDLLKDSGLSSEAIQFKSKVDNLFTGRARVGYAFQNFMLYGTGGIGLAHTRFSGSSKIGGTKVTQSASGYGLTPVAGAGAEYRISDSVSLRAEYLYAFPFDVTFRSNAKHPGAAGNKSRSDASLDGTHLIRVGVSYHLPIF